MVTPDNAPSVTSCLCVVPTNLASPCAAPAVCRTDFSGRPSFRATALAAFFSSFICLAIKVRVSTEMLRPFPPAYERAWLTRRLHQNAAVGFEAILAANTLCSSTHLQL